MKMSHCYDQNGCLPLLPGTSVRRLDTGDYYASPAVMISIDFYSGRSTYRMGREIGKRVIGVTFIVEIDSLSLGKPSSFRR
jgi:hypothetical protein